MSNRRGRVAAVRRAPAVLCGLAALTCGLVGGSASAVAPAGQVAHSDLPTVSQVAAIYPSLEGGSREVFANRDLAVRTASCTAYRMDRKAASGRWSLYRMSDGTSPYFSGLTDPSVFVYKFYRLTSAQRAMAAQRGSIRRCEGLSEDADGFSVNSREVPVPTFGDARVAHRETTRQKAGGDRSYELSFWIRQGRYLVEVRAQRDPRSMRKAPVVRLARVALDRIA